MKRNITIILLCVFLITMLAIPAMAAGSASLSVSDSTVHRGDTVEVTIKLSGVGECTAGSVQITCGSGLEWQDVTSSISGVEVVRNLEQKRVIFYTMSGAKVDGKLMKLKFKVKSDAKFEANEVKVTLEINGAKINATTKITVTCDHKYGAWNVASDASKHTRKCSICGNVETKSHTYDHDCDTSCNDCNTTRDITHSFSTDWVSDETGHWYACTTCGEKSGFSEHVPGAPAGEYTDQICTACNYVLASALGHQHKYGDTYEIDAGGHWNKCLGCGEETAAVPHVYGSDCDASCDDCGYERAVQHKVDDSWTGSAQAHWKVCSECSARVEQSDHIWDGGSVTEAAGWNKPGKITYHCGLCKVEKTGEIPALTVMEAMPWWGWLIVGAVGGVAVTVGVGLVVIMLGANRKNKGRFSN